MSLEKDHHVADFLLLFPGSRDHLDPLSADPLHLMEFMGVLVNHLEGLFSEFLDDSGGHDRTDSLDQTGSEILLDAADCCGNDDLVVGNLELSAEFGMIEPCPFHFQHFTRHRGNQVAYDGNGFCTSGEGELGYRVTCLFVRIGYPLNLPLQDGLGVLGCTRIEDVALLGHRVGFAGTSLFPPYQKEAVIDQLRSLYNTPPHSLQGNPIGSNIQKCLLGTDLSEQGWNPFLRSKSPGLALLLLYGGVLPPPAVPLAYGLGPGVSPIDKP